MNAHHRLARLLALATVLTSPLASAQTSAPRIRGPIEPTPSVPLRGSLNPHTRFADDLGALAPDTVIPGVTLVFSRSAHQQSDLDQLLTQQTDPSSPLFHHWLTPVEFNARFGPAPADVAATQTWLQSHGFTIDSTAHQTPDRITFSGTAAQIHQAFGAELHRFRSPATPGEPAGQATELHFAPASDISLPAALAPVISAVLHLHDFRPKPSVHPHPQFTSVSGVHYLAPDDIFTMYDLTALINPTGIDSTVGRGQHIAIIGQSFVNTTGSSGISTFQGLLTNGNSIHMVIMPGTGSEAVFLGDEGESDIDLEYSSGIAQHATIFFVYTGSSPNYGVFDALAYAITEDIAPIISISYGECEPLMSSAEAQQHNAVLQQAAAQGQTVVASSGDSGSTACILYGPGSGLTSAQLSGPAVNFPADSPYVTAVGGTQMAPGTFTPGSNQYWMAATTVDNWYSLRSYVPEVVWNEPSSSRPIASGGGASILFTRPSWQSGITGIPSGSSRLLPDVSLQASTSNPGYIICSEDPTITGAQSDCGNGSLQNSNGVDAVAGGTSFAAPILAGSLALLNKYVHANGLGNINPVLYSLAAQPSVYTSAFHDITIGTISTGCNIGGSSGGIITCGLSGNPDPFAATTGYDQATGLGSLDFGNLAAAWPSTTLNLLSSYTGFASNLQEEAEGTATAGSSLSLQVGVYSGSNGHGYVAPTGAVSLSLDGDPLNASVPLSASDPANQLSLANITFTAPSTTGSHILVANYPGDANHAPSSGAYSLLVGNVTPSGAIALSASNLTIASNGSGSSNITITPTGGYNGMLTWTVGVTGSVATSYCYYIAAGPVDGTTSGTMHLGVNNACNSPGSLQTRSSSIAPLASLDRRQNPGAPHLEYRDVGSSAAPFLALLLFAVLPRSRRKPLTFLAILFLVTLPVALTGCGGGSGSTGSGGGGGGGGGGTTSQVYTVTVTAKDSVQSTITASTSFTLTVD